MRSRYLVLSLAASVFGVVIGALYGTHLLISGDSWRFLTSRDWPKTIQAFANVAQITALIVAGWWTYSLFVSQRRDRKRANLIHRLVELGTFGTDQMLRVEVTVQNIGNVVLAPPRGEVKLYQVMPIIDAVSAHFGTLTPDTETPKDSPGACEFPWKRIAKVTFWMGQDYMILEPGESASFSCDFCIPRTVRSLFVRSQVACGYDDNPELHWYNEKFHQLTGVATDVPQ